MQFTKIASVLAMAAAAIAAPASGIEPRTGSNNGNNQPACSAQSQQVCCDGLSCLVPLLGAGCSTSTYCCESDAPLAQGGLVNVNALNLNCVQIL
ncbi:hypothetical protein FNYG_10489 [Fusarium nygamai]|uniref:Hydrophobin n=1 Tax=Gibberella nygamai TaxID=42673 RepID=A0A2K0W1Q6_GIBNY|nr:hypothetical protein FNYG_10489 [Fusarium nygamai]